MTNQSRPFLIHIHYFRAFAIINIMLLHLWSLPKEINADISGFIHHLQHPIFHGGTIYFVFISGFLFQYLSEGFQAKRYLTNKFLFVILPYIFLSVAIFVFSILPSLVSDAASALRIIRRLFFLLLRGNAQIQFWYIPFITVVFLVSPLLLKLPARVFNILALCCVFLPLLGTRTETHLSLSQYLYFFPIYITGMYTARNYEMVQKYTEKRFPLLILGIAGSFVSLYYIAGMHFRTNWYESAEYINKMTITLVVLSVLRRIESWKPPLLSKVAELSFPLYFLHLLIPAALIQTVIRESIALVPILGQRPFLVFYTLVIALFRIGATLVIIILIKALLGPKSRYLIGS